MVQGVTKPQEPREVQPLQAVTLGLPKTSQGRFGFGPFPSLAALCPLPSTAPSGGKTLHGQGRHRFSFL